MEVSDHDAFECMCDEGFMCSCVSVHGRQVPFSCDELLEMKSGDIELDDRFFHIDGCSMEAEVKDEVAVILNGSDLDDTDGNA